MDAVTETFFFAISRIKGKKLRLLQKIFAEILFDLKKIIFCTSLLKEFFFKEDSKIFVEALKYDYGHDLRYD